MKPRVSVVMPLYNKAPFVEEAIASILHQSFRDFELLIIDDASTDNSFEVASKQQDERIRLRRNSINQGTAGAANQLLEWAQGEYIVRLDADDIAVPNRIEQQVAYMDNHPQVGVSSSAIELFGAEEEVWRLPLQHEDISAAMLFFPAICQGASIIRRSVIQDHNLTYHAKGPIVGEDWLFWLQLAKVTEFGNSSDVLVKYRIGSDNVSQSDLHQSWKSRKDLCERVLKAFGFNPSAEELELHNFASGKLHRPPKENEIAGVRAWLDKLVTWNKGIGKMNQNALQAIVDRQWDRFFYLLVPFGKKLTDAYFTASSTVDPAKKQYLLKAKVGKWLGR